MTRAKLAEKTKILTSEVKRQQVRSLVMNDTSFAQNILDRLGRQGTVHGWCTLTGNKPTKAGGYIQVSAGGANHFMMLQHVVLCAAGQSYAFGQDGTLPVGMHASHLCGNTQCTTVGHVHIESVRANNQRKGCHVWIPCPHVMEGCSSPVILVCPHTPVCIKYVEGFVSMDELVASLPPNHRVQL